ncbi:unnamed protein product [Ophioblennius macclurei]
MGANLTTCCFRYYVKHNREEKRSILRMRQTTISRPPEHLSSDSSDCDTEESIFGPLSSGRSPWRTQQSQTSSADLWTTTNQVSNPYVRRGSDRELQAFITMRNKTDEATEEWEKLNYDIHTLRYARREVRSRWRKILLRLGYQCEVDNLLCVNRQSRFSRDPEHLDKATQLLKQLLDHTSLFPPGAEHQDRYLFVMDRLVSLDSAEDFVRLAKEKYPQKDG